MKIIHFTDTYYPIINGVSFAVEQYAQTMADQGHEVIVLTTACSLRQKVDKQGNLTIKKVSSVPFPIYPGIQAAIPNIVSLYRYVKEVQPDIIHIHTPFVLGILGTIFGQIFHIPVVNTYHTLFSSTSMYLSPRRFFPNQHKNLKPDHSESRILDQIIWRLQMIFFDLSDLVLAPTKVVAKQLKVHGLRTKLEVLPSGLSTENFDEKSDYTPAYKLLCLGRLGLEKSIDVVIKAFAIVHKEIPQIKLEIAGDGPAKQSLIQLVKELHLEKSITFLGMVEHKKTPEVYKANDIFVTASTMETQGLVLLEAMLSGLPVVAAAVNAPVDLVTDGENGYLFPENDAETCAKQILSIYKKPEQLKEMGQRARNYALAFDCIGLTKQLITLYKTLSNRSE